MGPRGASIEFVRLLAAGIEQILRPASYAGRAVLLVEHLADLHRLLGAEVRFDAREQLLRKRPRGHRQQIALLDVTLLF